MANIFSRIAEKFGLGGTAEKETQLAEQPKPIKSGNIFAGIVNQFKETQPAGELTIGMPKKANVFANISPAETIKKQFEAERKVYPERYRTPIGKFKETLKEIARYFPREGAGTVLEVIERVKGIPPGSLAITPGAGEILPEEKYGILGPKFEKFLFGKKPVESLTKQGEEALKGFGVSDPSAKQFGLPMGMAFLGLDLLPPGGKDILKILAKANKADDVKKILFGLKGVDNAKITDGVINTIAKTTDEKTIKGLVENLKVGVPEAPIQKTGVPSIAAKEADSIAKEIPNDPTKWNRFSNSMGKFMTSFKEKIVNDWQRVKELKTEGMKLTNELTPYERRKLMAGRQTARLQRTEEVVRNIDKDILDTSKKLKIKDIELQNDVFDYLKARHAPERNAALGEKAAGITTKEAGEITARLEKSPHATEIKRIADGLQKFHNETLDILYQGGKPEGVISKELYDTLKTKYKNHIPLQRVMETDDIAEVLSGRGLAVKGTGLKRAVGSEKEVRDIMENIYTARTQAIQRVEKNIVDNETFRFAEDYIKTFPEQELFEIVKPPAIGKTFEGKIITKQINDPSILQLQRFGKPTYIKINDPRLAVALRGVNREQLPAVMRYISTVTRWMSALVTRYSPEFVLSNKIRDMQEAVVYMASQDGFKGAVKTGFRDPGSLNDVKNFVLGKETAGTKLYQQMIEDGGTTGGMALSTRKQIEDTLQNIRSTNRNIARKGFKELVEGVDKWNTVFEDSTRLSAYKTALESGMSREKAAIIAKDVSIDFNEFGTWGPVINSLYMFANASIQGSAKMIRAMKNPKVATAVIGTVGAAVFSANSWNDRVDPEWRSKVSKWDKLNGLNIIIPGTEEFYYISIPVSWGLKPIKVAMEYGTDVLSGQTVGLGDATEGIFTAVLEGYNPVGGTDLASALTPSPIEPFVDIARNRQWTGGKLRPDWNKYAPASTQYFKDLNDSTTGKWLIASSQSVSEKTGGRIEISPADAEYVLQQITGGPGKFTGKVFNSISAIGKGEVPEVRDIPFLSRVFRKTPEERFYTTKGENDIIKTLTEQERKRFYDKQEAEIIFEELKKMPVEQRKETYKKLKEEKPQIIERVNKIASDEEKNLTRLDRQILDLGVENGARAKYLFEVFKSAEPQERKELYREYLKKGIISGNVKGQLDYLFAQ